MAPTILATALTVAFGALAWLGLAIYGILVPVEFARGLSPAWRTALGLNLSFPWEALPWQALSLVSLAWVAWGATKRGTSERWPPDRRLLVHLACVVTLFFLLGVAMTLPMVDIARVIGR